jgi:hypothetical protein
LSKVSASRSHPVFGAPITVTPLVTPLVSGTVIQKCVLTEEKWYKGASPYLFIYVLVVLKIANEAVVEGMCGFVDKHAIGHRGLKFENYAFESIVHYNMPAQAHSNDFIFASLRKYGEMFLGGKPLRFTSNDKQQRSLHSFISKVVDRLNGVLSKLSFL